MAVTPTKGRPGYFKSSRTGFDGYTSEIAAQHYDTRQSMSESLAADRAAEEAAAKLTPDELLAIYQLAAKKSDTEQNRAVAAECINAALALHPEYVDGGADGARNAGALLGSLESSGATWPYSIDVIHETIEFLSDRGALILKPDVKPSARHEENEEYLYKIPLEELRKLANGF